MAIEIKAPTYPESVQEGTLATWHKNVGDSVTRDELLVDIETDKVVLEVVAPVTGVLTKVLKAEGDIILSNEIIATIDEVATSTTPSVQQEQADVQVADSLVNPAAKKRADELGIDLTEITGTGKGGRITKEDVVNFTPSPPAVAVAAPQQTQEAAQQAAQEGDRVERRVPMTRMRARIAERLLEVTQTTASLTTFNEVDMSALMGLRKQYQDEFTKTHNGTRLGFMGFFVRASVEALKRFPLVNSSIDGNDVVYHGFQDIGVAVSTDRGLVVPVLRNAENMSIATVENSIGEYATKARDGKLTIEEMTGGTFTITNGGVYGSLLSTPIINPPQTAILGMHTIQQRPVAVNGQVEIRPMMNL
ncbi:MAG: 2-oxoglutarate dehydrogenase E2 component (dihydrolipoamide succinyltransferase), partial [Porticoccaceae bacterium]